MEEIKKSALEELIRTGQLPPTETTKLLEDHYYKSKKDWKSFLSLMFLSLGSGLMCAGVIFFFAYNWDDIHKFVKMGIVLTLLTVCILPVVFGKLKSLYSNILLTISLLLVGVTFAVYGQIYQTGADAHEFFMIWTAFTALWAFSSRFSPIWVVFLILTTTTIGLYFDQEMSYKKEGLLMFIFIAKFALVYFLIRLIEYKKQVQLFDKWFDNLLQLTLVVFVTTAVQLELFSHYKSPYILGSVLIGLLFYIFLIIRGLNTKNIVSVSIIPFSVMWIISAMLLKISDDIPMILFLVIFTAVFMIGFVRVMLNLLKRWRDESNR